MQLYQTKLFEKFTEIVAFFTTSGSGNLAFHVGDDPKAVTQRHKHLALACGYEKDSLVFMNQVHSDTIHRVTDEDFHMPPTCDALITNQTNKPLMVMVADCTPILLFDPLHKAIAAIHAGRKGAFLNITTKTIQKMQREFGSKPQEMVVALGPSIGACCYEVGEEIFLEATTLGYSYAIRTRETKHFLDVNAIIKRELLACGVLEQNIEHLNICTCCSDAPLYSYRKEGQTGRFAGVIMLPLSRSSLPRPL